MINYLLASFRKRQSWMPVLLAGITILLVVACTARPTLPGASPIPASDVGPPATLPPEAPDPTGTPPVQPRFAISADRGWDTLGMFVRPGQEFEISAAGSWRHVAEETPYGPGGTAAFDPNSILPSAPIGALIGRIGNNPPFEVGVHTILTAEFGGELSLSINEPLHALSDNTGSLEVSVILGPLPDIPPQLLTNYDGEYILLYPAGYHAVIYEGGMCLTQAETTMMACHVANALIEVGEAGGRTLDQVADEIAAQTNPDIEVRRASLMVSGVEAVLLDDIYSYDVLRKVVMVHRDRTYVLTFVPWTDHLEDFPRLEKLYETVIRSFAFLPQPESPPTGEAEPESHISAVTPVTIYSGPGRQHPTMGVLQAGEAARVIGRQDGDYWPDQWIEIACPDGMAGGCWVLWDMNALYPYEGPPVALDIPDPANLAVASTRSFASPDGRWGVQSIESEAVSLGPEEARFFYVEFTVTSLVDGTTWTPVSEWHAYGLGLETAPLPFYWSQDGRYLYYTSLVVPDGGCGFYANSGESLDRLDLSDGSVITLQPPYNRWMLAISPDEARMAYLSYMDGYQLIVRDLEGAYSAGPSSLDSIQWQVPLDLPLPRVVSEIGWSPDGQKVLVMVADIGDNCQPARAMEWELDVETGVFTAKSTFIPPPVPTPTPPAPCTIPEATGGVARETFLIFCGGEDHVNIIHNDSLIIDGSLTVEAYVNYLGGGGYGPRVIEIIDTFNLSFAENKVWFCLFSQGFETNQGNGWHCLTSPQPKLNQWVHLAGSWDGKNMYLFIDGKLKAVTAFPGPLFHGGPGDQNLKIGNGWTLIDGFNGFIDEVRLSSIARYRADFVPQQEFIPDEYTVGLWHFDEGQGAVVVDESGQGNHGNLSPFLRWGPAR